MMPQDLFSDSLVASPESQTPRLDVSEGSTATGNDGYNEFTIHRQEGKRSSAQQLRTNRAKVNERNDLHPYVQTLSLSNLESCVALENAVFSELERCAREKVGPPDSDLIVNPFLSRHSIYPLLPHIIGHSDLANGLFASNANASCRTTWTFHIVYIALRVINPSYVPNLSRATAGNLLLPCQTHLSALQ